jgi:hypothetical protein
MDHLADGVTAVRNAPRQVPHFGAQAAFRCRPGIAPESPGSITTAHPRIEPTGRSR